MQQNIQLFSNFTEPSHVPHKLLVPKRIALETEKELPTNEEGQKGKHTKKKKKCR
jgi:hypothetical protein